MTPVALSSSTSSSVSSGSAGSGADLFKRLPPHSIEMEQALLACALLEGGQESLTICLESKIKAESFYKPAHQIIYGLLMELYEKGDPIDTLVVGEKLKARNQLEMCGGYPYLNEITDRIDTSAHIQFYAKQVKELYMLRTLIRTSLKVIEDAHQKQDDLDAFIEGVEQNIFKISEDRISDSAKPLKATIEGALGLVNQMVERKGELTGLSTGLIDLDRMTFGFHPQEMVVVGGRPSMGKTSLSLNFAEAVVFNKNPKLRVPVLVFSLEMSAESLAMRMLCSKARVDMQKLKDGFVDKQAIKNIADVAQELRDAPIWIDDSGQLTVLEMRAKARRLHAQKKLGMVVVDYLQLVSGTDNRLPREQQIAEISRGMKAMAKELNVPVIVGCQLNRDSEKERRQPRLSDMRESGSIEQDADLVILISRKKGQDEEVDRGQPMVQRDLIIAKQRNGPVGAITTVYNKSLVRFENYTPSHDEPTHI